MSITVDIAQAKANLAKLEQAQLAAEQFEKQKKQVLREVDQQVQRKAELEETLNSVITETRLKVVEEQEQNRVLSTLTTQQQELQKNIAQKQIELHNLRQDIQIGLAGALWPIVQLEVKRTAQNDSIGDISHAHSIQFAVSNRVRRVLKNITEVHTQVELT
jgi:chromosome segregation ATPase